MNDIKIDHVRPMAEPTGVENKEDDEENEDHVVVDQQVSESSEDEKEWVVCCSHSSVHFIKYMFQVSTLSSVMIFSMYQISRNDVENKEIYFSLLGSILGTYLPSPELRYEKN